MYVQYLLGRVSFSVSTVTVSTGVAFRRPRVVVVVMVVVGDTVLTVRDRPVNWRTEDGPPRIGIPTVGTVHTVHRYNSVTGIYIIM